ncbi:hypothetical protein SK128_003223 [Halocaridina rubra]|uniref:Secreted protein n=1 Tax=Halocaridina rubra TaxID=373956 RepID=A0AAN8WZB6_HALRR
MLTCSPLLTTVAIVSSYCTYLPENCWLNTPGNCVVLSFGTLKCQQSVSNRIPLIAADDFVEDAPYQAI